MHEHDCAGKINVRSSDRWAHGSGNRIRSRGRGESKSEKSKGACVLRPVYFEPVL
jgi:hypothetical protein